MGAVEFEQNTYIHFRDRLMCKNFGLELGLLIRSSYMTSNCGLWYVHISVGCQTNCFSFSPLGKHVDRAVYFACVNFFNWAKVAYLRIYWTDFCDFFSPNGRYLCACCRSGPVYRFLERRCHGNQFWATKIGDRETTFIRHPDILTF